MVHMNQTSVKVKRPACDSDIEHNYAKKPRHTSTPSKVKPYVVSTPHKRVNCLVYSGLFSDKFHSTSCFKNGTRQTAYHTVSAAPA